MVETARRVVEGKLPHAGLELLFTPKEEVGLRGAAAFDCARFVAQVGYVYDQAGPIGEVVLGAPYSTVMFVTFTGQSAHAGMAPEEGRSAIAAAARAIADMRLGRLDEETTANVGTIGGGMPATSSPTAARSTPRRARTTRRSSPTSSRRCSTPARSRPRSPAARWRPRSSPGSRGTGSARTTSRCGSPSAALERSGVRADLLALRRRRRREHLQHARASPASTSRTVWPRSTPRRSTSPLPTSTRWSGSRWRCSRRRVALSLRRGHVTAVLERHEGLARIEVDGEPCVAYPRLTGPDRARGRGDRQHAGAGAGARLRRLRRPLREPDARSRPRSPSGAPM